MVVVEGDMTTFYRDRAVHVGSHEFEVGDRAYPLDDLERVWHNRGRRGMQSLMTVGARVLLVVAVLGVIAAAGLALRQVDFTRYNGLVVLAGALLAVVLVGTVGMFVIDGLLGLIERYYRHRTVEHRIWARYHGEDVLLFATRDRLRFGQVYRALERAVERGVEPRPPTVDGRRRLLRRRAR
jgi:hypothetical protein